MKFKNYIQETDSGKAGTIKRFLLDNFNLTEDEIEIHEDLSVSIHGDLISERTSFKRFPCAFREIKGGVTLSNCQIQTLIGLPEKIQGDLMIFNTKIPSLEYAPTDLQGGSVYLTANHELVSLKGCPQEVDTLSIADCEKLRDLSGGPRTVKTTFKVDTCDALMSISGLAEHIGKNLFLTNCRSLESLKNIHKSLNFCGGKINVSGTRFKSHIMGLFFVKGIKGFEYNFGTGKASQAFDIIFKATQEGKDQLECQDLLIDANLESFAGL